MGRFNNIQNSFSSGELSRNLESRTDIKEYAHGAAIVRNMKILRHGGAQKREGLIYGRSVHSPNFTNLSIVNFRPGGLNFLIVIRPFNGTTTTVPGWTDTPILAYSLADAAFLEPFPVYIATGANYSWSTYGFYETNLNITPGRWTSVHYGNNLILTHSSGEVSPLILTYRRIDGIFQIVVNHLMPAGWTGGVNPNPVEIPYDPGNYLATGFRVPYQPLNTDISSTLTLGGTPGAIGSIGVVTATQPIFASYINTMPGTPKYTIRPFYIHLEKGTNGPDQIYIMVYNILSTTTANYFVLNVVGTWASNAVTPTWRISSWGGNIGYPRFVTVFQERLILAGTPAFPDTIWCSYAGNIFFFDAKRMGTAATLDPQPKFYNYKGDKTTADPFDMAIASDEVSVITWLNTGIDVRIGTLDTEYAVGNVDQQFSDANSFVKKVANIGGAAIPAASAEGSAIFISKDRKKVFSIEESSSATGYVTKNLSLLASDIFTKRIEEVGQPGTTTTNFNSVVVSGMTWSRYENTLWMWTNQSEIIGMTFAADAGTLAWHRHDLSIPLYILNCCVAQNRYGTEDNLWVLGYIDGEHRLYYKNVYSNQIEMNNNSTNPNDLPIFMDNTRISFGNNGSLISVGTNEVLVSESRIYIPRLDFAEIHVGHPIKFVNSPIPGALPPQLTVNTTYYAIPVRFLGNSLFTDTNNPYAGRTSIRIATTQANAYNNVFITFTAPTGNGPFQIDTRIASGPDLNVYPTTGLITGDFVDVVVDGLYVGNYPVDVNGNFTLPPTIVPVYYVASGISYASILRTMDINAGSQLGMGIESIERIDRVLLFIYKSKDGTIGGKDGIFEDIEYDTLAPNNTRLETIKPIVLMPNGPDSETFVEVKSKAPLPLTVNGMVMRGTQHD